MEGPFGDHTGFYTPPEEFPLFRISAITMRRDAIYPSIVVGKPPAEDEWLAKATERIFLPAIRMSVPELVDYDLPTAGAFHNCVIVSIRKRYPGHARKVMHAVWGLGLLSLAKAVVVVDEHVDVHDYEDVFFRVCANVDPKRDVVLADGPIDQLDHAAVLPSFGGKIGFDATDEGARRRSARVAARDRDDGRGARARRRPVGRARVASALRPTEPCRMGAARSDVDPAGRFAVDTRQCGWVESRSDARSHRVSDEQHDTPHVPAPSLWPIGFAIGVACILVGLVVSVPALIVGALITLVFGFLWIRDLFATRPVDSATAGAPGEGTAQFGAVTEADLGTSVDRATFLSLATIGVGGLIGAGITPPGARLRRAALVHRRGRRDVRASTSGRSRTSPRASTSSRPTSRAPSRARSRAAPRSSATTAAPTTASRASPPSSAAASTSAARCSRTGRSTRRRRRRSTASSSAPCSRPASAARATAASTTPRATGRAGPPVRSLDRFEFSILDGNLVLGRIFSVGTVEGTGANAQIPKYYTRVSRRARRRARAVPLSLPDPGEQGLGRWP